MWSIITIFVHRYTRKTVECPVDASSYKYASLVRSVEVTNDEDVDYDEAIRKTFGVRSNAMQGNGRDVGDVLSVYPLLRQKHFVSVNH